MEKLRTVYLKDLVKQKNLVVVFKDIGGNYWTKKFKFGKLYILNDSN